MERDPFRAILSFLYGEKDAGDLVPQLLEILEQARPASSGGAQREPPFSHRDAFLISYADMLSPPEGPGKEPGPGETGLSRLGGFLKRRNSGVFSYLHILPFHPYSSDDGFSVIDYRKVDPRYGAWEDLEKLARLPGVGGNLRLAFDFVINHGSVQSPWFKAFLAGEEKYSRWYITRPENYDCRGVTRPRTLPLLTAFTRRSGDGREEKIHVWTTFSADQADYDFSNPQVLLEFVRIFLEYAERGAGIVRLDAIAYLWKEDGHSCVHHPKTHAVVKLFRAIIDHLKLPLLMLTETNVPHEENISYFGAAVGDPALDALPEAHMVYNFALPPLVLHAALSGDAGPLRSWAGTLPGPEDGRYFLNFLASHDGVGLTPARGVVEEGAFAATLAGARKNGALISYKSGPQGDIPYELNCSYASLVAAAAGGDTASQARAFAAVHGVLFSLSGLPAVYFHSWIGSPAWEEGPRILGYNRAINREKPPVDRVEAELDDPESFRFQVHRNLNKLISFRQGEELFGPGMVQRPLGAQGGLFVLFRGPPRNGKSPPDKGWALCIENLSREAAEYPLPPDELPADCPVPAECRKLTLAPWETRWLVIRGGRIEKDLSLR